MTPKEKAKELCMKFDKKSETDNTKQCALISVDEMIYYTEEDSSNIPLYEYFKEVKQEIEKL